MRSRSVHSYSMSRTVPGCCSMNAVRGGGTHRSANTAAADTTSHSSAKIENGFRLRPSSDKCWRFLARGLPRRVLPHLASELERHRGNAEHAAAEHEPERRRQPWELEWLLERRGAAELDTRADSGVLKARAARTRLFPNSGKRWIRSGGRRNRARDEHVRSYARRIEPQMLLRIFHLQLHRSEQRCILEYGAPITVLDSADLEVRAG